ncbi:MAG: glutamate synthase subunit alpha, partial [Acidobacteria bacterium]|nr:glutamate synthase subunit alpha [Acidobacteriota bacterium]
MHFPERQGLYDPRNERDSCGIGFLAHIKGQRSHQIVVDANEMLINLSHRGACGCEPNTGDGAGFLTALPHEFLAKVAKKDLKVDLPPAGKFAAGVVFLPTNDKQRDQCKSVVQDLVSEQGQKVLGWRSVPTDAKGADIGPSARATEPAIEQLFIAAGEDLEGDAFERQLYVIRKRASNLLRGSKMEQAKMFYICSLSTKVLVYKGQLMSEQLLPYFPDLGDSDYTSHLAMIHARFSTNTFPSWDRAQPNRFMCHNGEINTLRGNTNWMQAREGVIQSELFGEDLSKVFPVVEPDCSDSGNFDNVLEFLIMTGRILPEAAMMMIPEAWENHTGMSPERRALYEYDSCMMETYDNPASIAFTDGHWIGAVLDRNGLRPSRFYLTHDDRVIMASEVGVLKLDPANVKQKGRLQPGKMFLV